MLADDRVLLIDFENVVGGAQPRESLIRSRITALITAAGPTHHKIAGYAPKDPREDPVASVLAELGVASWPVPRGTDAADRVLLRHAHYAYDRGCRLFTVASGDGRFARLADLGRLEVLAWTEQTVSRALVQAAGEHLRRLDRPPPAGATDPDPAPRGRRPPDTTRATPAAGREETAPAAAHPRAAGSDWWRPTATAVLTGIGMGVGQRLADAALRR